MQNLPCVTCRECNHKLQKLIAITEFLHRQKVKLISKTSVKFNWNLHQRCHYGISACTKLREFERQNGAIVSHIEPLLSAFITQADKSKVMQLLNLLRGAFPMVYSTVYQMIMNDYH